MPGDGKFERRIETGLTKTRPDIRAIARLVPTSGNLVQGQPASRHSVTHGAAMQESYMKSARDEWVAQVREIMAEELQREMEE